MKIITLPDDKINFENCCVALGNFDGMHRGHKKVILRCIEKAKEFNCASVVYTFEEHPKIVLGEDLKYITLNSAKEKIIEAYLNPDFLIFRKIDKDYLDITPQEFVTNILKEKLNAKCVVVGEHYTFGKKGEGTSILLKQLCNECGIETEIIPLLEENGSVISSTSIREAIKNGNIESANKNLGYKFFIDGEIVHGNHIGTSLGFPTINIIPDIKQILPEFGVYATKTVIDEKEYLSVTNVGVKPTIGNDSPVIETYLFDTNEDLYQKKASIIFYKKLRSEKKFLNLEELKAQIKTDEELALKFFKED
ncbi:MAG: bifunctional riboflavin kinase/FAD synthetase [Clostridia bacterium]|nr:bifunctional riboflavin kinase/FAD synthetase [Clostridia bacterium]